MINNEKGRSMIEMLGVLSITGILSMSGISLYSKALYQRKISNTIEQVSELIANMRNTFRNRRTFKLDGQWANGKYSEKTDDKNLIPKSMISGGTVDENGMIKDADLTSAFGTQIIIKKDKEKSFYVEIKNATKAIDHVACLKIVTADWGKGVFINGKKNQSVESSVPVSSVSNYCGTIDSYPSSIKFLVK